MPAVAQSPTIDAVPAAGLTSTSSDSKSSPAAGHGLTEGAIAGIVLGSLVGAALMMTLAAFTITKVSHCVLLPARAIVSQSVSEIVTMLPMQSPATLANTLS